MDPGLFETNRKQTQLPLSDAILLLKPLTISQGFHLNTQFYEIIIIHSNVISKTILTVPDFRNSI